MINQEKNNPKIFDAENTIDLNKILLELISATLALNYFAQFKSKKLKITKK